ncbi:MAG: hypothetical protein ACLUEK_05005 [Oscillospiraceae bacterium]
MRGGAEGGLGRAVLPAGRDGAGDGPRRGADAAASAAEDGRGDLHAALHVLDAGAFARLDTLRTRCRPDTDGLVAALRAGDVAGVARRMYNVFEDALDRRAAQAVGEIKRCLLDNGALGAVMSGLAPRCTACSRTARPPPPPPTPPKASAARCS